jgi:dipeptidyl aminopeptidase/acylaminoacyl peptidase
VRNLGVGDMWDVMSGVDSLIARGIVDEAKLASMGWSQGGYISAFLTTNTDRFKAISVGAGISNWMTYYVNTDITPFTRQYLHTTPWDDEEIYRKTSPMTTIKQAKTPTLIQLGSADKRVPVPDSYELYRGLQDRHVVSRLILYTGFGHPITKPKSNRAVMQANLDWFSHYIWGEDFPKDSALLGSGELETAK